MILYHITTSDRLQNILKDGLVPGSESNRSAKPAPFIMLSKTPEWGLFNNWKKNKPNILLEVCLPSTSEVEKHIAEYDDDPEGIEWYRTIKPEQISKVIKFEIIK